MASSTRRQRSDPSLPRPISATADDLPPAVAGALANPERPRDRSIPHAGINWHVLEWGRPADAPLLLVHGVTSSAAIWWRVGPALAAAGYRAVAVDQAGHGATRGWLGHHRFADNATDVAGVVRAAALDTPDLAVVGHSWGALTVAHLPSVGLAPSALVLIDPPAIPLGVVIAMLEQPTERRYDDLDEAIGIVRRENPHWSEGDVRAKAEALTAFDEDAVRAVMLGNAWDGGLAAIAHPSAATVPTWIIRGEPQFGGYVNDRAARALAARVGVEHVVTIAGGPHSPQRTHPEATVAAVLDALRGG